MKIDDADGERVLTPAKADGVTSSTRERISPLFFAASSIAIALVLVAVPAKAGDGAAPTVPSDSPGAPDAAPPNAPPGKRTETHPEDSGAAPSPCHEDEDKGKAGGAPPARTGLQIAIRPGVAIPLGSADKKTAITDVAAVQFAATVDVGVKIIPNLFVGGYAGLGVGGASGALSANCDKVNASCSALTLRIGIEAQLHIVPDGGVDPWVGYGFGYEATSVDESPNVPDSSVTAGGFELAHLMGGVDFRISRTFGIGPFVDLSVAQFSKFNAGVGYDTSKEFQSGSFRPIQGKALHEWLTVGCKILLFP